MTATPRAPQRNGYFVRNRLANFVVRSVDACLRIFQRNDVGTTTMPRRILISNGAHLGDVVVATAVIDAIRRTYPHAEIGMLVGSWSEPVVRGHPSLSWIHVVDHWIINRQGIATWRKILRYLSTRARALREIRAISYDAAVDLYFYMPNSILLLRQSGIPVRIGYTSAGFGPLLTKRLDLQFGDRSILDYHYDLLCLLPGWHDAPPSVPLTPSLDHIGNASIPGGRRHVILHMGSGSRLKSWPQASWAAVGRALAAKGYPLAFTGVGATEAADINAVLAAGVEGESLCNRLSWPDFTTAIRNAALLISVDSVAVHIAAAAGTPTILIGHGMNNPILWRPRSESTVAVMNQVPCAPCYINSGCEGMDCIRGIETDAVVRLAEQLAQTVADDTAVASRRQMRV